MHNAKAIPTTRRAGGLFVLQSFVFRISEKLLIGEQGLTLTTKMGMRDAHSHFCFLLSYEKNSLFTALKIPRMEDRVMLELTPTP